MQSEEQSELGATSIPCVRVAVMNGIRVTACLNDRMINASSLLNWSRDYRKLVDHTEVPNRNEGDIQSPANYFLDY